MKNTQKIYSFGLGMLAALYALVAGAQSPNASSPFSLETSGQEEKVSQSVPAPDSNAVSPFALPEAVSETPPESVDAMAASDSPFALPSESELSGAPDDAQAGMTEPEIQAESSPFDLPEASSQAVAPVAAPSAPAPEQFPQPDPAPQEEDLQALSAEELRGRGTALAREGQYDEARQMLALSLQKDPESVVTLNNLGLVMRKLGRVEEAVQAYVFAIELDVSYALTYKNLGILMEHQGEHETAVEAYRQYVTLAPSAADAKDVAARADWLDQQ